LEAAALPIELRASGTRRTVPDGDYHTSALRPTTVEVISCQRPVSRRRLTTEY